MGSHIEHTRWGKVAGPVLLATHLAACSSWRVETVPAAQLFQAKAPSDVRVTRADGSTVVLHTPSVVRDSLWGWSRGDQLGMPLTDVRTLATRHADVGKSVALGVGVVVGAVAATAIVCAASECFKLQGWR